ncbi:MAG: hypothetical protein ABUL77_04030, partial [Bacteroidota bacterium]
ARRAAEAARTACAEPAPESRRSAQTRRPNAQDRVTSFSLARTRSPSRLAALKARRLTAIAARAPRTAALASRGRGDTLAPAEPDDFAPSALPPAAFTAGNGILVVPITR